MAYLEITLQVDPINRGAAAEVYQKYRQPFLDTVPGALSKELLVRDEDVQVLHGFRSVADAKAYLTSELFTRDVVGGLSSLLKADPDVRVYDTV
ncbi:antibiotic biosynthesis monooxygenase family protein [Streptomyces sp. NPDC102437]|uniref:antibiotic biosynthesis monooxygenase family protein n=1 Tax=Streptomyces sp. NPDC102437 TaxID=3366175 RepID=UPI00382D0FC3